tara:strand:+ start:2425 stop:3102 length:678 start_codon:yes stop_codon:yes gene_type:complete
MVRKIKNKKSRGKKRDEITLKRMRLQFQATSAELLESEIILEECMGHFNKRFETGRQEIVEPDSDKITESHRGFDEIEREKEEERDLNREEHEEILPEDKDLRDLFKKIAIKTHPDKLKDEDEDEIEVLTELYKEAANAAELGDGMALLEIAYELGISIKIDATKETEWLSSKILMLQEDISEIKSTVEWIWYHSEGVSRNSIEKKIQSQLGLKIRATSPDTSDE